MTRTILAAAAAFSAVIALWPAPSRAESPVDQFHREMAEINARHDAQRNSIGDDCSYFSDCGRKEKTITDNPSKPYELENSFSNDKGARQRSMSDVILRQLEPAGGR